MKNSGINWTHHTFNAWIGCTRVSPGCKNCYAETLDRRNLHERVSHWGPGAPRKVMSDTYWRQPVKWNAEATAAGERRRVFSSSLADVFDEEGPIEQRERLWQLIRETPSLDWLLLTKRPQCIRRHLPTDWGEGYSNVWLGVSVEDRKHGLPRVDALRDIPAAIRFLSIEPLLEDLGEINLSGIHWVIVGGESGSRARSMDVTWVQSIIAQCSLENVAVWVKQLGKMPADEGEELVILGQNGKRSGHADTMSDWPEYLSHLRVRELPSWSDGQAVTSKNEATLGRIDFELGELAAGLSGSVAEQERVLRPRLIDVERSLFLNRAEKGRILLQYKAIYGPLRKWSAFLRVIGLPRQSSYDLMAWAECTNSVQSTFRQSREVMTVDQAISKASLSVARLFERLNDDDKRQAAAQLVLRLTAEYGVAKDRALYLAA